MKHKIKIYSLPSCPHCIEAKKLFKDKGVGFEDFNVEDEKNAEEVVKKTKQYGVPVIEVNGKVIIGFDKEKIKELLEI